MAWLGGSGLLPGSVGSGIYSAEQTQVFATILQQAGAGKTMTASSRKELKGGDPDSTGFSGEPKVNGLAGGHAYTILDAKDNASNNPATEDAGPYKWIKLRNPWGQYGRSYDQSEAAWKSEAVEGGDGIFWIELADFWNNFKGTEAI